MGCGSTNTRENTQKNSLSNKKLLSSNNIIQIDSIKKDKYFEDISIFENFMKNNDKYIKDINNITDIIELNNYINSIIQKNQSDEKENKINIDFNIFKKGVYRLKSKEYLKQNFISSISPYNGFVNIIDKINQLDSDISKLKEIININTNYFHSKNESLEDINLNMINFNLDLTRKDIAKEYIINIIEQLKYEYNEKIESLVIQIPANDDNNNNNEDDPYNSINILDDSHIIGEISDAIIHLFNLKSAVIAIIDNLDSNFYKDIHIDNLEVVIQSFKYNTKISNIGFGCINCVGIINDSMFKTLCSIFNENYFSLAISNIGFKIYDFESIFERVNDMSKLKLLLYECPENTKNKERTEMLAFIANTIKLNKTIEVIYLLGFDECSKNDIIQASSIIRSNKITKNVIVQLPFRVALKKYIDYYY